MEILALGLAFIPAFKEKNPLPQHVVQYEEWANKIDTAIHFCNRDNQNAKPPRGWLQKDLPSIWVPPSGSWRDDERAQDLVDNYLHVNKSSGVNSTPKEIKSAIKALKNNQFIHILKADKGRNAVIWLVEDYDKEAQRQLDDALNYKELSKGEYESELLTLSNRVILQAKRLYESKFLTKREFEALSVAVIKGAYIYFLAKTHKGPHPSTGTFHGRPIVATHSATIHLLDKFITRVTAPLLTRIPGSLRDTFDLLEKLPNQTPFPETAIITADVDALYPNIPWREGLNSSILFYRENLEWLKTYAANNNLLQPPDLASFAYAIELVLTNSYITFKNRRWFRQIRGTAMGMCISVYFANTYMYYVTKKYVDQSPSRIFTFLRYIDDIVIIFDNSISTDGNLNLFETATGQTKDSTFFQNITNDNISYTVEGPSYSQSFLDVLITIDNVNNLIITCPFKKPTASNSFLHAQSNHPLHTFRAVPLAQFQRLRRISSTTEIFKRTSADLIKDIFKCGYDRADIWKGYNRALNMSRHTVSDTRKRAVNKTETSVKLITRHNTASSLTISRKTIEQIHETARLHYVHLGIHGGHAINIERGHCLGRNSSSIVTNVGQNVGSFFTKSVKNPDT